MATGVGNAAHPRILQLRLDERHPARPAIDDDQVYYQLARYADEERHVAEFLEFYRADWLRRLRAADLGARTRVDRETLAALMQDKGKLRYASDYRKSLQRQ